MDNVSSCLSSISCTKDLVEILSGISTLCAAIAAFYWFLFTRSFRRRIQFDVDLQILDIKDDNFYAAEMMLIVENKGQREHRIYNLLCEARQSKLGSSTDHPPTVYLPVKNIVPKEIEYYFVAADVRQTFTRPFLIPKTEKLIRAIAFFSYESSRLDEGPLDGPSFLRLDKMGNITHSVSRLFAVKERQFGSNV